MEKYRKFLGKIGENIACNYLLTKKYKIIERNFSCKHGEIDIIAKEDNKIIFIEVKTRKNCNYGRPSESVNKTKRKHMYKTANFFLYINNCLNSEVRFDVIEIIIKNQNVFINHIKQIL